MATSRYAVKRSRSAQAWWRPVVYSAVAAAIAALFAPVPAFADPPSAPQGALAPAVPDIGSRPMALGTLVLPGQPQGAAASPTPVPTLIGATTNPALQKIEKGRAEIATMGDQLIQLGQDRDLAQAQLKIAEQKYDQAETILRDAQTAAADAAAAAMREAAAMPPGSLTGLGGLDDLARLQRGDGDTQQAAARQLEMAQIQAQLTLDQETLTDQQYDALVAKYAKLSSTLTTKQAAQQALELANAPALSAAEAAQSARDSRLGANYLSGSEAGRGADPRAIQALTVALAQRGDPYVWSEEGPDEFDCSGLMQYSYKAAGFNLRRVSRDQYQQTSANAVDRYSLLPGDLLFFSYTNSWRGIHHVAMYAGNGMMVEAPRTGLNVRLTKVRWGGLFGATRVFGSVDGVVHAPVLGAPDADPTNETPPSNPPKTTPTTPTTPHTTPPTTPRTTPPTTPHTTPPTTRPATPTTPPTTTKPVPTTTPPKTDPTTPPATTAPANPPATTNAPGTTGPTQATTKPAAGGTSSQGSSSSTSSAAAAESSATSGSASKSSGSATGSASSSGSK